MAPVTPLIAIDDFHRPPALRYLNTAAQGLVPKQCDFATQAYFSARTGTSGDSVAAQTKALKVQLAKLLSLSADDIALPGSTSEAINLIYSCINADSKSNIVVATEDDEFPSVLLPAQRLRDQHQVQLRAIDLASTSNPIEALVDMVDARTRLLFVSQVSYRSGRRLDIEALAEEVRRKSDAIIAVDSSQALGVVPVPGQSVDFVVSTAFKWLLGAHGVAILGWNRTRHSSLSPAAVGWHSVEDMSSPILDAGHPPSLKRTAERFELGNAPYLPIFTLAGSLPLVMQLDPHSIESHALDLSDALMAGLDALNAPLLTPRARADRAGIVAWSDLDCGTTAEQFRSLGVHLTGNMGRIRTSMHLYNSSDDIAALLDAYRALRGT